MCLILLGVNPDPEYRLVVAANRDEFYARPTRESAWWQDEPHLLAGRDLRAGGTWLGITRSGRFAAVTNFREDPPDPVPPRSRGDLTTNFLLSTLSPADYLDNLKPGKDAFRGFNLLVGDTTGVWYFSNREGRVRQLESGFYGLSNQLLDCDWPKVVRGRSQLARLEGTGFPARDLYELILCEGDGAAYSQSFIRSETYGTSASTALRVRVDGTVCFEERNFRPGGEPGNVHRYTFTAV